MVSSLKERALRGVTWAAVGGNGAQILSFLFFIVISRAVGPSAFGAVAIALLILEVVRVFCSECIAANLVSTGEFNAARFNAGAVLSTGLSAAVAIALMVLSAPLAAVLGVKALASVLPQIAPILVLITMSRIFEAELMLQMEFRALSVRSLAAAVLGGVAGVSAAYAGYGVEALILQQWAAALISVALLYTQMRWRPALAFTRDDFVTLARQSAALSPANFITNLRQTFDGFVVAAFSGVATAGVYNFAKRTRLALQLGLSAAITRVSLPTLAQLKDDPKRLASALNQSLGLTAIVAFPIFIGLGAVGNELVSVFLGPRWLAASTPLALLMIGGAVAITTRISESLLLICDRRGTLIAVNAASLSLLMLAILLVGRYGAGAIAAAVSAEGLIHEAVAWYLASRIVPQLRLREYLTRVWLPLSLCIAMLLLIAAVRQSALAAHIPAIARLVGFVILGVLFYISAAWLLARSALNSVLAAARVIIPERARQSKIMIMQPARSSESEPR